MKRLPKQFKIYRDPVKERHTSHWDWDWMTTAEIEAEMLASRDCPASEDELRSNPRRED